jgi:sugar transferase (PEP-CTERM system associated)
MRRMSTKMALLAAIEFLLAALAVPLAALVRFSGDLDLPEEKSGALLWVSAAVFAAAVVVALTAMGLYQARQRLNVEGVLARMTIGLLFAAVGQAVTYYFVPQLALWRGWWLLSFVSAGLLLIVSRVVFARIVDQTAFRRRVVVYGAGNRAAKLLQLRRRSDQRGFQIMAFLPVPGEAAAIQDARVDGSPGDVGVLARKHQADEIVIAMDDRRQGFPIKELLECKFSGIDVIDILGFLERESGKVNVDLLSPSWMIFSEGFTHRSSRVALSRMLDLIASFTLLALSWPFILLTALAILIEDGRPTFYRQTRVGIFGKPFELVKFRSMRKDAEQGTGARWATKNDDRVTRVGAVIRKLRVDELPQLFNVIKGDMRFVGPRPERPEFVKELSLKIPYYHERHCVRPGLTGWAQLCYPYGSSEKDALEKLQFDLYYLKNQSLIFDIMILLQTVEVVIWGKGAR